MATQPSDGLGYYNVGSFMVDASAYSERSYTLAEVADGLTATDLVLALERTRETSGSRPQRVLDMSGQAGAAVGGTCRALGSEYHTIYDKGNEGEEFDVTYHFAVAPHAGRDLDADNIADQLHMTRSGGVALFTQLDWENVHPAQDTDALAAFMKARTIMQLGLSRAGYYGSGLGEAVRGVAAMQPGRYDIEEAMTDLPNGNYRELFLGIAEGVLERIKVARDNSVFFAGALAKCLETIRAAEDFSVSAPRVVTVAVAIGRSGLDT